MDECYLSATDHNRQEFGRRLDVVLAQLRRGKLGNCVKWRGLDEDGDAVLRVADETAQQAVERIASEQGLRLYRMSN